MDRRKEIFQRLRCIDGHTQGVIRMVEGGADWMDVIRQLAALQGALGKVRALVLHESLSLCLAAAVQGGETEDQARALDEITEVLVAARSG